MISIVIGLILAVATISTHANASEAGWKDHLDIIRKSEGLSLRVIRDVDDSKLIGYGLNLDVHPGILRQVLGYTRQEELSVLAGDRQVDKREAEILLSHKAEELWEWLDRRMEHFGKLDPKAQAALISMAYNSPRLVGPRMTNFVNSQQHIQAALEAAYGNKFVKELPGLQKRRIAEALLYHSGECPKAKEARLPLARTEMEHSKFYKLGLQLAREGKSLSEIGEYLKRVR
jgi:GH24 family phage-related lysozyme (muramidase)